MENGKNLVGEPSADLFRKSDARRGFDPQYRQIVDVEMWFHLLEKGDLAYTREPLCAFRSHSLQQTERHARSGAAWKEHAVFIASHAVQPQFPRKVVFPILHHLRRWRGKTPDADTPEMLEWQRRLAARWGAGEPLFYWWFWVRHRLAKPFSQPRPFRAKAAPPPEASLARPGRCRVENFRTDLDALTAEELAVLAVGPKSAAAGKRFQQRQRQTASRASFSESGHPFHWCCTRVSSCNCWHRAWSREKV